MRNYIVKGLSPDAVDHEWTGCGWGDEGRGVKYTQHEAEIIAHGANYDGDWIAWVEPVV